MRRVGESILQLPETVLLSLEKYTEQWPVVCDESKFATVQVLVELFDSEDKGKSLFFNLSVIAFTGL